MIGNGGRCFVSFMTELLVWIGRDAAKVGGAL
jgi:hypothetical protein